MVRRLEAADQVDPNPGDRPVLVTSCALWRALLMQAQELLDGVAAAGLAGDCSLPVLVLS